MSVSLNEQQTCRGRGRPPLRSDEQTLRLIVDAARHEFHVGGYAGTGMSAIAARAGVSTKTLYRLVPTKAELFRLVIRSRAGQFILAADELDDAAEDLAAGLERLLTAYGSLAFDPDVHHCLPPRHRRMRPLPGARPDLLRGRHQADQPGHRRLAGRPVPAGIDQAG